MPTRAREAFADEALGYYSTQTHQDRELVIIDDSDQPSFPIPPKFSDVQYYRISPGFSVGAKRNIACSRARGEVICHWDDDDYSAPERIEDQLTRLIDNNLQITGYHSMRFHDIATGKWWQYTGDRYYALGTSLLYTKAFWDEHRFPDLMIGEDSAVTTRAGRIVAVDAGVFMFARTHPGNTAKRMGIGQNKEWSECV